MDETTKKQLTNYLAQYITENKLQRIDVVLQNRTRYITLVLEDLYQSHNASAVIRSCECFGVQDLYAIENKNPFRMHKTITSGSGKWVDVHRFAASGSENIDNCLRHLRKKKYQIVATTLQENAVTPEEIDLQRPVALVFGNEELGISDEIKAVADSFVKIPMHGFTQSFNVSVSAALLLSHLVTRLRKTDINWHLTRQEILDLRLKWIQRVEGSNARKMDLLTQRFFAEREKIMQNGLIRNAFKTSASEVGKNSQV